jgi:hypothetical protein
MNIQVSHESPLVLQSDSLLYNDYDYALVHLFEHEDENVAKEYFQFFKNSVLDNRVVYLDNSIFELGQSFDPDKYAKWIIDLQPTYYIVPDVLEASQETVESFIQWFQRISQVGNSGEEIQHLMCIGVVQGRDWNDLVSCYKFMSANADMVAISFDYDYYLSTGRSTLKSFHAGVHDKMYSRLAKGDPLEVVDNPMDCSFCKDKQHRYMTGRQRFIQHLIDEGVWDWNKDHHLLGCSLPQEFKYYTDNNIYNIRSIDTSNPVMAGMQNYRYHDSSGMDGKPAGLLANRVDMTIDDEFASKRKSVLYNTDMFKQIIRRDPIFDHSVGAHCSVCTG